MSDEIKPLTKKILESGIIDESMAAIMEQWGALPEGAAALAVGKDIEHATREQLLKLADEVGDEVEKAMRLRESMLDLDRLKWPVMVGIWVPEADEKTQRIHRIGALIDRMGRYYFRFQDVAEVWLHPGAMLMRGRDDETKETILEVTQLFIGDEVAAVQVSTTKL